MIINKFEPWDETVEPHQTSTVDYSFPNPLCSFLSMAYEK